MVCAALSWFSTVCTGFGKIMNGSPCFYTFYFGLGHLRPDQWQMAALCSGIPAWIAVCLHSCLNLFHRCYILFVQLPYLALGVG